jgi:hypothetical protein
MDAKRVRVAAIAKNLIFFSNHTETDRCITFQRPDLPLVPDNDRHQSSFLSNSNLDDGEDLSHFIHPSCMRLRSHDGERGKITI